jgi:predicted RNA methylase
MLQGSKLAGGNPKSKRVENDYYATPFNATKAILDKEQLDGSILECACGEGHICKVLKEYYPNAEIEMTDLVQRQDKFNLGVRGGVDFLGTDFNKHYDNVITNPPFCLAQEFIEKALSIANKKVIMFAKIQLLEGKKRKQLFKKHPPKYIYVFSERVNPMRNGAETDDNGKAWASTMCFAWFVWEKGSTTEPIVRWLD